MKKEQINIRDPFVMVSKGKYYLYGTRSATTWGKADGFDCYESSDLVEWEGPFEIYHKPENSSFDCSYWAPECYEHQGKYYLITTLGVEGVSKAIYALVSDSPKGPFEMHSKGSLTPNGWKCIDGTLYFEEGGKIYLVFSHTFEDAPAGEMCSVELSDQLDKATGEPKKLFEASDAGWNTAIPFAKKEFGIDGAVYFSDGPCVYQMKNKKLLIIWSSWSAQGYAVGIAESLNGKMEGNWKHQKEKFYPKNGGHGMVFQALDETFYYTLHFPDTKYKEAPVFYELEETKDTIRIITSKSNGKHR